MFLKRHGKVESRFAAAALGGGVGGQLASAVAELSVHGIAVALRPAGKGKKDIVAFGFGGLRGLQPYGQATCNEQGEVEAEQQVCGSRRCDNLPSLKKEGKKI